MRWRSETRIRGEALETLTDAFPEIAAAPPWKPLKLADGDKLMGYTGPNTAKVDAAEGGVMIVDSQLPLRARPSDGGPIEPVSYNMLAGATSFRPDNPLVETIINKDLAPIHAATPSPRPGPSRPARSDDRTPGRSSPRAP